LTYRCWNNSKKSYIKEGENMVTRQIFEDELNKLHSEIVRMGIAVENSIADALTALIERDGEMAERIIAGDDIIDDMELKIEKMCLEIIARQQPVAKDLRDITSALKLITDFERIADHAADISERILALTEKESVMVQHNLILMGEIAKEMIRGSLDAYVTRNIDTAKSVITKDDKVDSLYLELKADYVRLMGIDPGKIEQYVELLLICKYFERIADHAQNVAEWVVFYVEGSHKSFD